MRVGIRNFDWWLYEEIIRAKLYEKAKNHTDLTVTFSPKEIHPNFVIPNDKVDDFSVWLKEQKIASRVYFVGKNLFECVLTDSFMDSQSDKEIFINIEKKQ